MKPPAFLACILLTTFPAVAGDAAAVKALLDRGDAFDQQIETHAALEAYENADRLEPNCPGIVLRLSKQYSDLMVKADSREDAMMYGEQALNLAQRCVALDPSLSKAHLAVAVAYGRLTDFVAPKVRLEYSRRVKAEADKALALDPSDDFAYHVLGRWNHGIANISPLLKALAKVVYGSLPEASNQAAVQYFRQAIKIAPRRIAHRSFLARTYAAMGEKELARKEWKIVLSLAVRSTGDDKEKETARQALAKL